jgi:hypothetical protein
VESRPLLWENEDPEETYSFIMEDQPPPPPLPPPPPPFTSLPYNGHFLHKVKFFPFFTKFIKRFLKRLTLSSILLCYKPQINLKELNRESFLNKITENKLHNSSNALLKTLFSSLSDLLSLERKAPCGTMLKDIQPNGY